MAEITPRDLIRRIVTDINELAGGLVMIREKGLSFFQGIDTLSHLDDLDDLITIYRRRFIKLTDQKNVLLNIFNREHNTPYMGYYNRVIVPRYKRIDAFISDIAKLVEGMRGLAREPDLTSIEPENQSAQYKGLRPKKSEITSFVKSYALMYYSKKENAPIRIQQRFHDKHVKLVEMMKAKYPGIDLESDRAESEAVRHAKTWWAEQATRGPGKHW